MVPLSAPSWHEPYEALIAALPGLASRAPLTLCGMGACVDARVSMHDMAPLLETTEPAEAVTLSNMLKERAARGIGGEVRVDWPDGPTWLSERLAIRRALGGTGPQAAWVLSRIGAPAVVALEDRSAHMLAQVPGNVLLAAGDDLVPAGTVVPHGARRPEIFIFEYTAGHPVGDVMPTRSSRTIVRFNDPDLEHDRVFDTLSPRLARSAGAGLVSGFGAVPGDRLDAAVNRAFGLARAWRGGGLKTVHLELGGFDKPGALARVLEAAGGAITSIGMSHSELLALDGQAGPPVEAMLRLGERLCIGRVCIHADHWAASVTLGDPERERVALMLGCLLAASRAAAGTPVNPDAIDPAARFHELPFAASERHGAWSFVACASPYLERPVTTLGLGDTFTAGCLLALGQAAPVFDRRVPPVAARTDVRVR